MRKLISIFTITLLTMGLLTNTATAAHIINQMQPILSTGSSLAIGSGSNQKLAQTINVSELGVLKGVFLPIACDSGKLKITVADVVANLPGSFILTSKKIAAKQITNDITTFRYFALPGSVPLLPGDQIALILENPKGSCGLSRSPAGNSYLAGEGFFDARPNLPGWMPLSETESDWDLPFMLVLKTP